MSQIGERLGISRHRVGRLLREAIETGVVKIEIQSPFRQEHGNRASAGGRVRPERFACRRGQSRLAAPKISN